MTVIRPTRRLFVASMAGAALPMPAVWAQGAFPSRPLTIVVPFAAGGSTDIVARLVAQQMAKQLGQQVIVENRAGAGGNAGSRAVASASPDGYTMLMGTISTHALNTAVMKKMPYDPVTDFEPISLLAIVPNVMVVNPQFPAKTVKECIDLLKANPDKYSYASSGNGTPLHLSGELFKSMAGVKMQHVPYRGAGPALNDVVANVVPIMFDNLPSSSGFISQGTLRGLATLGKERAPSFPDLPTMSEAGLPGYETYTWNALFAPAKTPKDIVARLNAEANAALKDALVKQRLTDVSATIVGSTPDQLREHVKAELAKWIPIAKAAGIEIEGG
ncbi:MAG: ABC transporter substrate-binding protein [Rhizobiales bacterium 65-9]|nr:tripartite tricarboxylate transporter substrate binding protein [Hyphomicrobiales bacterium]OJY33234.1 MAG: ABC transporter substrate-binding protein [Rhizobiales bacterium 65-9]